MNESPNERNMAIGEGQEDTLDSNTGSISHACAFLSHFYYQQSNSEPYHRILRLTDTVYLIFR